MGSFNIACSLTKINIYRGDEIMVFPLLSHSPYEAHTFTRTKSDGTQFSVQVTPPMCENVYSSENWAHMLPFKAEYNDYGFWEGENYKDGPTKAFLDFLINNALIIDGANNESEFKEAHENYKAGSFAEAMENFGNIMHSDELYVNSSGSAQDATQYRLVKFAAVDMKAYKIIEQHPNVIRLLAKQTKDLDAELKELEKAIQDIDIKDPFKNLFSISSKNCHLIKNLVEEAKSYNTAYTGLYVFELVEEIVQKKTDIKKARKDLLLPALKNKVIQGWIHNTLSHVWSPINYAGQNYSNKDVSHFLYKVALAAMKKDAEHEYDDIDLDGEKATVVVTNASFDIELIKSDGTSVNKKIDVSGKLKLDEFSSIVKEKIQLELSLDEEKIKSATKSVKKKI